jgi:hypothetical protein
VELNIGPSAIQIVMAPLDQLGGVIETIVSSGGREMIRNMDSDPSTPTPKVENGVIR